jgi:hypothetical protein
MKVERLERETTSVCTFRFPYCVGVAFGIFAASSLASPGLGFSNSLAAFGRRNSIFATAACSLGSWRTRKSYRAVHDSICTSAGTKLIR